VQTALDALTNRIKEIQQSIYEFLRKLEMQDRLDWPAMLDSFVVISSQFSSVLAILRNERTPPLRNLVLLPIRLSLEVDPQLQQLTENRLNVWNHAVAPDYLRTKAEPHVEELDKQLSNQFTNRSTEQLQKQITSMNKCLSNIIESVLSASSAADSVDVDAARLPPTFNSEDTKKLIAAVTIGKDMKTGPQAAAGGGKYASSAKTGAKQAAAAATHPYPR